MLVMGVCVHVHICTGSCQWISFKWFARQQVRLFNRLLKGMFNSMHGKHL
jgi:hypothetical protein